MTNTSLKKNVPAAPAAATHASPSPIARSVDRPDVWIFPPVLPLGGLALGFILEWLFPFPGELAWLPKSVRIVFAVIVLIVGLTLIISSRTAMMRAKTNVDPRRPALHLVQAWPFSWTRNPMYLGGNVGSVGLGLAFRLHWMLMLFPILIVICHYGVVLREEQYLERKFGSAYANYRARVRRWL